MAVIPEPTSNNSPEISVQLRTRKFFFGKKGWGGCINTLSTLKILFPDPIGAKPV
jgi:hypothetical protein